MLKKQKYGGVYMTVTLDFLKNFEYYCINEGAFEEKELNNKPSENFRRMMKELGNLKSRAVTMERYSENIRNVENYVSSLSLVHNTNLENIISIIKMGKITSIIEMEKKDIAFNYRITQTGIHEEMLKYVFCSLEPGDWTNGLCQIKFKKNIEKMPGKFLPKSYLCYHAHEIANHWINLEHWKQYYTEFIAVNFDNIEDYLNNTSFFERPEFLFECSITLDLVEEIKCSTSGIHSALIRSLERECINNEILKKIKY